MTAAAAPSLPAVGDTAPDFTVLTDEGTPFTLSSLRGRAVVLFFYPKNNTPGCTIEACALRDAYPQLGASKAIILGISPDSVLKHKRFRDRFKLPYNLLADTEHAIAELYGVWGLKSLFGRKYMGMLRTTFVIDAHGKVAHVFEKVSVLGHAAEVMAAVSALK